MTDHKTKLLEKIARLKVGFHGYIHHQQDLNNQLEELYLWVLHEYNPHNRDDITQKQINDALRLKKDELLGAIQSFVDIDAKMYAFNDECAERRETFGQIIAYRKCIDLIESVFRTVEP